MWPWKRNCSNVATGAAASGSQKKQGKDFSLEFSDRAVPADTLVSAQLESGSTSDLWNRKRIHLCCLNHHVFVVIYCSSMGSSYREQGWGFLKIHQSGG